MTKLLNKKNLWLEYNEKRCTKHPYSQWIDKNEYMWNSKMKANYNFYKTTKNKKTGKYEYILDYMKEPVNEKELEEMHWRFSESVNKFDRLRNTDFLTLFPELKDLYY